ncbi:MAG: ribonucleotide-diphosphate reductase subunit alpha, partial [Candidatus Liptonbacteria bacterium]|nr:ribonucleotide-diphosphate reductase subunit alpha [Candidatus Liptonbacteria bacterium]
LGSINLAVYVENGKMNWSRLKHVTRTAVRLMDNVIDLFEFPVPQVTELAKKNRRIGLGIMGFADMLYQLGVAYNSPEGQKLGEKTMKFINETAHGMSEELAKEKGVFPNVDSSIYKKKGAKPRNAALTTVAPTGSISMMFDCSSGIEPQFALSFVKQDKDGTQYPYLNRFFELALKKAKLSRDKTAEIKKELLLTGSVQGIKNIPEALRKTFVVAMDISAEDHMKMQAAFQRNVDNSISKTINFPNSATKEDVFGGFVSAWKNKCKSATVYRDGSRSVQILNLGTGEGLTSPSEIGNKREIQKQEEVRLTVDEGRRGPKSRPSVMSGRTYRVKTGYGNIYVTINNDDMGEPFEIFATIGKSGGFFQEQSEGICRLISLALRSGVKVSEIISHIKGIRGPMPTISDKGTILSLPDAIGKILEEHVRQNNEAPAPQAQVVVAPPPPAEAIAVLVNAKSADLESSEPVSIADFGVMPGCPECGLALQITEGCLSCKNCGFSRCG